MTSGSVAPAPVSGRAGYNVHPNQTQTSAGLLDHLHQMSVRGLARMFDPAERTFVFRIRRGPGGQIVQEGLSPRYTAITLLGMARLAREDDARILGTVTRHDVCERLVMKALASDSVGDVALTLMAAGENGVRDLQPLVARLEALRPTDAGQPIVEVAWALSALSDFPLPGTSILREQVCATLMAAYNPESRLFPHLLHSTTARSHVSCFADLIYSIQALAKYSMATGNARALDMASSAARHLCSLQGEAGQWWWHYDYRTGRVLERYPVYAIHQDAMGPMGLLALKKAGGEDCSAAIRRGLDWLVSAPEIGGHSLIDNDADLIWRKVARREPRKGVRYLQATASLVHPALRVPAVDALFPAGVIDYEDRPYHLGWLLYAWRDEDLSAWRMLVTPTASGR